MDTLLDLTNALHTAEVEETTALRQRLDAQGSHKLDPCAPTQTALDEANERYWAAMAVVRGIKGQIENLRNPAPLSLHVLAFQSPHFGFTTTFDLDDPKGENDDD